MVILMYPEIVKTRQFLSTVFVVAGELIFNLVAGTSVGRTIEDAVRGALANNLNR